MLIIYFYIYIYININFLFHLFPLNSRVAEFWTVSVSVSGFAPRPRKKSSQKSGFSDFICNFALSLDFLFLFATRRYVEFFDMTRPLAAFVAQDIKSIIKTIVLRNKITKMNMRTFTFKGLFLTVLFMLLGSTAILAADDGLITTQVTIKLDEAGTLPDKISESQKNLITNLKIVGKINGTDLKFIREMAGCDVNGKETDGKLSILDLSDAKIVEGGSAYYSDRDDGFICTSNDKLGDFAFYGCSGLTSLTLPSSVTKIGCYALSSCIGLTSLTLPSSVTEIGEHAFLNCRGLTNFTIPSGVTKIGGAAFFCCYGLISLTIPSSVTAIGSNAFKHCSGLTSIYVYMEKLPETGSNLFLGCDEKNCTVYVPKGTGDAYFRSAEFGYFYNIVEFDATGIDKVATSANVKEVSRYSANGQRLSAPAKGLNIVKYSDGSVKKVVVQ